MPKLTYRGVATDCIVGVCFLLQLRKRHKGTYALDFHSMYFILIQFRVMAEVFKCLTEIGRGVECWNQIRKL